MPYQKGQSGNPAGKPVGTKTKATVAREAEVKASGLTPLDYMLSRLRDETATDEDRKWAAQNAAPYVHPKLAAVQVSSDPDNPLIAAIDPRLLPPQLLAQLRQAMLLAASERATVIDQE